MTGILLGLNPQMGPKHSFKYKNKNVFRMVMKNIVVMELLTFNSCFLQETWNHSYLLFHLFYFSDIYDRTFNEYYLHP